jgi:hypothetical protein
MRPPVPLVVTMKMVAITVAESKSIDEDVKSASKLIKSMKGEPRYIL